MSVGAALRATAGARGAPPLQDSTVLLWLEVAAAAGGRGSGVAEGKLVRAVGPRRFLAAVSYARAASSAESKVPSQIGVFFVGSRISAA